QQKWRLHQERQGQVHSQKDAVAQQEDQEKAENGDQVPLDADPPLHTSTEQLSHTRSARDDGGHGEGCQGRPGTGCEDKREIQRTGRVSCCSQQTASFSGTAFVCYKHDEPSFVFSMFQYHSHEMDVVRGLTVLIHHHQGVCCQHSLS